MTAPAAQPVRRGSTVYMSQVTMEEHTPQAYRIVSTPHPIHWATVIQHGRGGMWVVSFTSVTIPRKALRYPEFDQARAVAAEIVARMAGRDLLTFNGRQRHAMGQQQCPKRLGDGVCGQPAGVGTVWCDWHPLGESKEV